MRLPEDYVYAKDQPWGRLGEPGRFDVLGVEWFACDPYPTWFRWEGSNLIKRGLDARSLEDLNRARNYYAAPWADEPPLPKWVHAKDPSECYGSDNHRDSCDQVIRVKWSGVGCACGARWYCA